MKFLGVYFWYVKMLLCGCVEHGLEYITFYVKKMYSTLGGLFWTNTGSLGAPAFVKLAYCSLAEVYHILRIFFSSLSELGRAKIMTINIHEGLIQRVSVWHNMDVGVLLFNGSALTEWSISAVGRKQEGFINTLRLRQNGRLFSRQHFHVHLLEWKYLNYD